MSLEWARARLLQHSEAMRKLCEAQAQEQARACAEAAAAARPRAEIVPLRQGLLERPANGSGETGTVLKFVARRRRA